MRSGPIKSVSCKAPLLLLFVVSNLRLAAAVQPDVWVRLDYNVTLSDHSRNAVFFQLFGDRPVTQTNFMQYVNAGKYDGTFMHRLAQNFVIQGGGYLPNYLVDPQTNIVSLDPTKRVDLDGNPQTDNPMIANEFGNTPARSNARGTIAMAKLAAPPQGPPNGGPNSASNEWFVNLANNAGTAPNGLDFQNGGFTVFGQVAGDGMEFYDAINTISPSNFQVTNYNQDYNQNGKQDDTGYAFDNVPTIGVNKNLVIIQKAAQIDYYGNGVTTTVPAGGLTFSARDAFFDTGSVFNGTGRIIVNTGRTLGVREGMSLGRPVYNLGTLAPGDQNGMITVPSYEQAAGGTLDIQIRGTTVDSQYDRLAVTGQAKLNGKMKVSFINSYTPAIGASYTVLTAGSFLGDFTSIDLPTLASSLFWTVNKTPTSVTLSVLGGDFDHNGKVDAADLTVWKNAFGSSVANYTGADGNGDGVVNAADYTIWRSYFGSVSTGAGSGGSGGLSSGEVPEPGTIVLFATAIGMLAPMVRRRRAGR